MFRLMGIPLLVMFEICQQAYYARVMAKFKENRAEEEWWR